ncbi:MAG: response regulator transcription factor [Acidobacteriota bacterium]|jgi:DNA-binding NarL/FixJ family response regulator
MLDQTQSRRSPTGDAKHVLVVDDHDAMRQALMELIETCDELRVSAAAASAEEAVEVLGRAHPDLVVADVELPGMSGIELTRLLHELRPDLPVLVLSSHPPGRFEQPALDAGACAYLVKREAARSLVPIILEHLNGAGA